MLVRPSTAFALSHWCNSAGIQHCSLAVSSAVARLRKSLSGLLVIALGPAIDAHGVNCSNSRRMARISSRAVLSGPSITEVPSLPAWV